jgi:flagellar protein FliJ
MKSPIESMLTLRRWEEDETKNLFVLAKKELEKEEDRLLSLEKNFAALRAAMKANEKKPATIDQISQAQRHLDHITLLIHRQRETVAGCSKRLEEAAVIMAAASLERKKFEKVDDRQKEAKKKENRKKEERDIDEHAVLRYKKNTGI